MNHRQTLILKELMTFSRPINSSQIAESFHISLRTAQMDLREIIKFCNANQIEYSYVKKSGYKILNKTNFFIENKNSDTLKIKDILRLFFFTCEYIKTDDLADKLFISTTTLSNHLKEVKKVLSRYNLKIISKPYYGSIITGSEIDKRKCIIHEKLLAFHDNHIYENSLTNFDAECFHFISSVVANILITHKFNITDNEFQNFLLIVYLSTIRSRSFCYLAEEDLKNGTYGNAYTVSRHIINKISEYYHYETKESEIQFLAASLYGKNSLFTTDIIPVEIEQYVSDILVSINDKLDVDLTYSIELRISLSLHFIPLIERIENNNQLDDTTFINIHSKFSYSFELAIIAAEYISNVKRAKLTEAEIAYLAIHFNVILEKDGNKHNQKNILFICSSRRSDSLLIKSGIYSHFKDKIQQIDVKNLYELDKVDFKKYDVIFSTILNNDKVPKNAIKLNHFLTESDYTIIEFTLKNGSVFKMIESLFSKSRFISELDLNNKNDVIRTLSSLSTNIVDDNELYESIIAREISGFTSYGNLIAIPHPESLLAKKSFCSVAILSHPIPWSESNNAQIIILCCASKNSSKDLQMLFNFISLLFNNRREVEKIINNPSYDNFIQCLQHLQHAL